ncbi:MAG: hypothetical protein QNJ33_00925 [Crocosphaera sp.]|nr:hypothetical protein [Crocosphaera sp.]
MIDSLLVEFSFTINDPNLEEERKQKIATQLLKELRQWEEVETVDFTEDVSPELGSKPGIANLIGWLTTKVKIDKIVNFLQKLPEVMNKKPLKISVKVGNNETTIEVKNTEDLLQVEETTKRLIEALQNNN